MISKILRGAIDFLSSYALAAILMIFLFVLTFLGTWNQQFMGLEAVQRKYFESLFLVETVGGIPIPLPGGYLLLVILTVNLILGGFVRMRRSWSRLGIYVTHLGILVLLASSAVSSARSEHGHLTLFEGERSDEFVSFTDWEVAIYRADTAGERHELLIGPHDLEGLDEGRVRTFHSDELPFALTIRGWIDNCRPVPVASSTPGGPMRFRLQRLPLRKEMETNIAGARATVVDEKTGETTEGLLWGSPPPPWGMQLYPLLVADSTGRKWAIDLRKVRRTLPFTIELDEFHHVMHPGMAMAKEFRSDVTKTEDGVDQMVRIEMNKPLRSEGYTLYQSNWGPEKGPPDRRLFSGFSVVRNPADQWPLVAMIVIVAGLLIQFGLRLFLYLRGQAMARAGMVPAPEEAPAPADEDGLAPAPPVLEGGRS